MEFEIKRLTQQPAVAKQARATTSFVCFPFLYLGLGKRSNQTLDYSVFSKKSSTTITDLFISFNTGHECVMKLVHSLLLTIWLQTSAITNVARGRLLQASSLQQNIGVSEILSFRAKYKHEVLIYLPYRTEPALYPCTKKDSESTDIQLIETKVGKTGKREIILYFQYIGIS
jgi:hypothetical protein